MKSYEWTQIFYCIYEPSGLCIRLGDTLGPAEKPFAYNAIQLCQSAFKENNKFTK